MAQTENKTGLEGNKILTGKEQDLSIMSTAAYNMTPEQKRFFEEKGYLIVRDALTPEETTALQEWTQAVYDLPRVPGVPWMPYEVACALR